MVKKFKYYIDDELNFECNLESHRCQGRTLHNLRCKRNCVIGFEYCFTHLQKVKHLVIRQSQIINGGKGLYAFNKTKPNNAVIFKKDEIICQYNGELLDDDERYDRYENYNSPYAVDVYNNQCIDAACKRGIGSMANTKPNHNNATFSVNARTKTANIKATKNIRNGEEIYLSYGRSFKLNEPQVKYTTK